MKINFSMAFVDLVFQILFGLMFVLSTMVPAESSLKIQPATIKDQGSGKTNVTSPDKSPFIISVDQNGKVQVKGQEVNSYEILESIIEKIKADDYSAVVMRVDKRTSYEKFLQVLEIAKKGPPTLQIELNYLSKGE